MKNIFNNIKENLRMILKNIKRNLKSKDKNIIINTIMSILVICIVAILIKIPFIFVRTALLDTINFFDNTIVIQNLLSFCFELTYVIIALSYIYRRLIVCFKEDISI